MHVLPYVEHWQAVSFLSAADVGIIPIHHWPNHEIALITKFFEYSHERLPIVVSVTCAQCRRWCVIRGKARSSRQRTCRTWCALSAAVLADPQRYRAAYEMPGLLDQLDMGGSGGDSGRPLHQAAARPATPSKPGRGASVAPARTGSHRSEPAE